MDSGRITTYLKFPGAELAVDPGVLSPCLVHPCLSLLSLPQDGGLLWSVLLPGRCGPLQMPGHWWVAGHRSDGGLFPNRQMLLYSQEVEEDYNPCEEDLFVL